MALVNYELYAVDKVTGKEMKVAYPAVSQLMAIAWAELCFRNNPWKSAVLRSNGVVVWSDRI